MHQIGDLIPQEHTFSVATRKQTNQDDIHIFINRKISEAEISNLAGLPVTSVERTVADLAASKIERSYLATLATDALRKEGVRFKNLASYLDPFAAYYRANSGRDLLDEFQQEAMPIEDKADLLDQLDDLLARIEAVDKQALGNRISSHHSGLRHRARQRSAQVHTPQQNQGITN